MNLLLLLICNGVRVVVMKTCSEDQIHSIAHNKFVRKNAISCLTGLSLDQCALECLLVAMCASINYMDVREIKRTVCEMNSERDDISGEKPDKRYVYVDIRDWLQDVAGTCASRPCAKTQRCIPTRPYRCMDIDCGTPPVLPMKDADVNMYPVWTNTTLGSMAIYVCRDPNKTIYSHHYSNGVHLCHNRYNRLCNADSSWTQTFLSCVYY